ncbi:MAG: hypothetical protein ACI9TH_002521 [Kiritimatiellia bacterium]|jgi:hypothetical protein
MRSPIHTVFTTAILTISFACAIQIRADEGPKTVIIPINPIDLNINEATGAAGDLVQIGDNYEKVKAAYGKPTGQVYQGKLEIFIYPRGQVELQDGKVVKIKMLSEQVYNQKLVRKAERLRVERERDDAADGSNSTEGKAKLSDVLADPEFDQKPLIEQINYWRKFKRDYPGVDVDPFYREALERLKEDN